MRKAGLQRHLPKNKLVCGLLLKEELSTRYAVSRKTVLNKEGGKNHILPSLVFDLLPDASFVSMIGCTSIIGAGRLSGMESGGFGFPFPCCCPC
jgi:hypothetical protein